jgi:2-haloacid dehalogenase
MGAVAACVFDAYGTLLDVGSAVRRHADHIGLAAERLSDAWRTKQLEYTWTQTLMQRHVDFWTLTAQALDYALRATELEDSGVRSLLLEAYLELDAYPDVEETLAALREAGYRLAVLSNGTPRMLEAGLASAHLRSLLDEVISTAEIELYKPAPEVYRLAAERLAVAAEEICFHSANPWDVAGAQTAGLQAVWINRAGTPEEYGLRPHTPELTTLAALPALVARRGRSDRASG